MLAVGISSTVSFPFLKRADWSVIVSSNLEPALLFFEPATYLTGHSFFLSDLRSELSFWASAQAPRQNTKIAATIFFMVPLKVETSVRVRIGMRRRKIAPLSLPDPDFRT